MSRDRRPGRFVRVNPDADDDRVEADAGAAAQAATAAPGPDMAAILQELNALRAAVAAGAVGAAAGAGPAAAAAGPSQAAHAFACELVLPSTMLALRKAVTRYDGRVSYDVFRRDFDDLVSAYPGLTDRQQFILLSSALEKEPKSLLEDLPERSFAALDDALRMAYSKPVHAPTEMRAFFALRQLAEETLEEWSTRVSRAARRAYPDTALVRVTEYAVQQFISGLNAPDVRSAVAGCSFPTMLQALEACRLARSRCPSPPPKRARVAAVSEAIVVEGSPSSTASPAAAAPAARGAAPPPTPAPDSVEARLDRLTKQVETMKKVSCILDTGAQISVTRIGILPGPRAPPSKLRLKDVNGGVSVLYGPRAVELEIGTVKYKFLVFEAEINDECIVGMDFIRGNRGIVDADELKFTLRNPVTHEKFSHPFTLQPSLDVGKFGAGCIYAVARATLGVEIQPYQTATCTVQLSGPSDLSDDDVPKLAQVLRARCVLESDGLVTWPKDGGRPRPRSTDSDLRSIEMEKSSNEGTIARSNSDHHETVAPRCGAASASDPVTTPFSLQTRERSYHVGPTDDVDQSLRVLPFGVVVPSDLLSERQCDFPLAVVPFAPGLIELEIQNNSGSHVILRKGSVVACVHPASLDELIFWYENAPKEVMVQSASLELIPFTDKAEIQLEPRLPPISKDQLPDDLQAMVDRCDLTSDQKTTVADVVRCNHDIFEKWTSGGRGVRKAVIHGEDEWLDAQVSADQRADPDIGPIYAAVQQGQKPHFQEVVCFGPVTRSLWLQFKSLQIVNGVLKRRLEHPSGDSLLSVMQTVVPSSRTKDLVVDYHMGPSSGSHFGVSKCYSLLKERFYWPNMFTTVRDVISSCLRCAQVKGPAQKTRAEMKVFREGMLFGRYHADFLGPLQASEPDGYRYVLVVVEAFSSWPEAIPLRTLQAEEVARALVTHVFSRLGAPYSIVTDQATTFESSLFKEVMDIYKVHKCRISGGKPSSNGKVENYIRSLTRQIAILANEEPSN
ncbi:Protein NYNRIN [Frankliniella fusca]|uniref:RNA-directed DNA polymerase n=1 Tax=Frankliniella fusca TaxID=407009 RepID=A0AAE1HAJ4_9NEOP|nr:Protein NYNRIN [Frankliniella fusca]